MKWCCISLLCVLGVLSACSDQKQSEAKHVKAEDAVVTVASVDGTNITKRELEYAIERLLGNSLISINSDVEAKVLDSLISSRAMALLAEQEMGADDKALLELKVKAYKEELLVKTYINTYANPKPVTNELVKQYYYEHQSEFSEGAMKSFEYIETIGMLDSDQRRDIVAALADISGTNNLLNAAEELKEKGYPVSYKKAKMRVALLDVPLKRLVSSTAAGQWAPVFNEQQVILLHVTDATLGVIKPLSEVSGQIRKRLSPLQLKESIKALSDQARNKVSVSVH